MPRVVILDPLAPEGLELLKQSGLEYEERTGLKGEALKKTLTEFDGAICRSGVKLTAEILDGNRRLRAIARAGVGVDNIDVNAAKRLGIIVMNTPAGNTLSTAEQAIALMLALSREIHPAYQSLIEGRWDRKKYMGTQLAGKTLGIVGLGRIGLAVARRAMGLEMKVIGFDPFMPAERARDLGIETVKTVKEMLPVVDYLTVHTPLTPETKNLIGLPELDIVKPGIRLINCARGGIYNEQALVEGLKSKKIGGVALDVYEEEPCTKSPLFGMENVVCTPHLGASTNEAQTNVAVEAAELLIAYFKSGAIRQAVNMPAIEPAEMNALRPFLNLGYRLGLMQAQLAAASPPQSCELVFRGKVAEFSSKLLVASFAVGLLEQAFGSDVNIINAEELLAERGVKLTATQQSGPADFGSMITTKLVTDRGETLVVSGTAIGNQLLRVVRIGEYRLEAYLDGILLVFKHSDKPGVIGAIGTILGRHQVNIAQMAVGRAAPGGQAIGVLNLDAEPPAAALQELLADGRIESCQIVKLPTANELPAWLAN